MASGTAVLDFGAFPGKSDASVPITGQANILSGSLVEAWIRCAASADHTSDEHMLETLDIRTCGIIPGTGFTIYGINEGPLAEPGTGKGTRIYGQWNVQWAGDWT